MSGQSVRLGVRRALSITAIVCVASAVPAALVQPPGATTARSVLKDLAGISELQSLFDRESDKTRVVLLLSPT